MGYKSVISTRILFFMTFSIILYLAYQLLNNKYNGLNYKFQNLKSQKFRDFKNFDNKEGSDVFIIPNWIHTIRLGKSEVDFVEAVCILAALKNQKPDYFFIHSDIYPTGKFWKVVKNVGGNTLRLLNVTAPKKIFGKEISPIWKRYHGSDILRLRVLRTYGGIYIDRDTYLVRNVNNFRRYEISLGWSRGKPLQNQIIIAHKDARLLKLWLKGYQDDYRATCWYCNAGDLPTRILEGKPEFVHAEPTLFGNYGTISKIFQRKWPEWKNYYSLHLMAHHQYLLKNITNVATFPIKFNEHNIHWYNITFRDMVHDVYPYT